MILITLGSQKFQFDRLLRTVDELIEQGELTDEVFAQVGYSTYVPRHFVYKPFLDRDEFVQKQEQADIVITHGGTSAIVNALKKSKKVIAVPRLARYGEHVDDHQVQLLKQFRQQNLILACDSTDQLKDCIRRIRTAELAPYVSNTGRILKSIENFLDQI